MESQQDTIYNSKFKTVVGCTPVTTTSFSWSGQGISPRAHPTHGQAANLANEKCEAGVHVPIRRRRRIPTHTEYFHSGGATTLSLIVKRANAIGNFVMRSETSGNTLCRLATRHGRTTRHWQTHPRQHHDHRGRWQSAEGENTFQCLLYGAMFIAHTGGHSTENESQESHLNSREKMSTGYLRAIQEFSNASENALRTNAAHVANSVVHDVGDARGNAPVILLHN